MTLLFFAMLATTGCEEKIITAPSATTVPNGDQRQSTDKKETGGDNVTDTDAKQQIATDVPIKPESTTKQTKSEAQQHLDILVEAKQHDASQKNALPEQHAWDAGKVPGTGVFDIESTRNQHITQIGTPDGLMVTRSIKLLDGSNAISCAKWNGTSWATVGPSSADDSIAFKNGSTQLRPKTQRNLTPPHPWDEMLDTPIISTNGWNSAPSNFLHIKRDQQVTMLELFGLEEERKSLNADGEIEKNTTAQYIAAALWTEGTEGFSVGDISRMEDLPGVVNLDGVDYDYRVVNKTPSVVWDSTDSPIVVYLEKLDDDWLDIIPPLLPRQRLRTFRLDLTSNAWTELPVVNIFHDIGRERDYSWRITTQPLVMVDKDDHPMVAWIESKKREEDGYLLSLSMRMTQWTGSEWEDIAAPPASQDVYATISNADIIRFAGHGWDDDGNLWISWVNHDEAIHVSRWNGQDWHEMPPIGNTSRVYGQPPKLAVSKDGQVNIAGAFLSHYNTWNIRVFELGENESWQVLRQQYTRADTYDFVKGEAFELTHTVDGHPIVFFTDNLGMESHDEGSSRYQTGNRISARIWDGTNWKYITHTSDVEFDTSSFWESKNAVNNSLARSFSPNPVAISSSGSPTVLLPKTIIHTTSEDNWNRNWVKIYQDRRFHAEYPYDWAKLPTPRPPEAFTGKLTDPSIRYGYDDTLYISGTAIPTPHIVVFFYPIKYWWQHVPVETKQRGTWEALPNPITTEEIDVRHIRYGTDLSTTGSPIASWFKFDRKTQSQTLMIKQWNGSSWQTIAGDKADDIITGIGDFHSSLEGLEIHRPRAGELYVTWPDHRQTDSSDRSTKLRRWDPDKGLLPVETLDKYDVVRITTDSSGRTYLMGLTSFRPPYYASQKHYRMSLLSRAKGEKKWSVVAGGPDASDEGLVLEYASNIRLNTTADDQLLLTYTSTESNNRIGVAKLWDGKTFTDYDIPGVDPEHTLDAHRNILRLNQSVRSDIGRSCFSWQQHTATRELLTAEFKVNCIDL